MFFGILGKGLKILSASRPASFCDFWFPWDCIVFFHLFSREIFGYLAASWQLRFLLFCFFRGFLSICCTWCTWTIPFFPRPLELHWPFESTRLMSSTFSWLRPCGLLTTNGQKTIHFLMKCKQILSAPRPAPFCDFWHPWDYIRNLNQFYVRRDRLHFAIFGFPGIISFFFTFFLPRRYLDIWQLPGSFVFSFFVFFGDSCPFAVLGVLVPFHSYPFFLRLNLHVWCPLHFRGSARVVSSQMVKNRSFPNEI